ncbi:RagB/SusD family nutrient uptake outer membrane protein [Marinifilum sp. RC60d5]|uniref:RagB/SusD family nutrient uptake outer membrane protein n=1 Tax=Marinifilum sp. RC60d5 TaxID=3458414 RepID=UPI0040374B14
MKLIKYMSLVVAVFAMGSCGDSVLELDNLGTQTSEIYFNDPENALAGLNACYSSVSKDEYFVYGDIMSDDALKGGSDLFDWVDREYIRMFTANSGNSVSSGTWSLLYTAIVRCNEIVNSLPTATFDEELKNRIIGEAKFLRAYSYSKLVALFGPVPLVKADYSVDNLVEPRSSEAAIYEFIKTDLSEAIVALPEASRYAANDLGRATKGAARALKARVLMQESSYHYNSALEVSGYPVSTAEIWDEVYELTKDVIESGEYTLASNFATIFEEEGENNEESIFEIQHKTTNNDWGESVGNTTIVQMGNRDDWGWCFDLPTDALYNTFGSADPRRECAIYGQEFNVLYGVEQIWDKQEWTLSHESTKDLVSACRLNRKYALATENRHGNHNNQPNNKRVIRYADVLLMHAEAAYYKGLEAEARTYVNKVRSRAESSTYPLGSTIGQTTAFTYDVYPGASVAPITDTGADLLSAIWKERRMELAMEGIRYFDLVRTGRTDLLPAKANYEAHAGLLPLPVGDVNTFGLEQNKGY